MPLPTLLAFVKPGSLINMDNSALDISEHNTTGWTAHGCAFLDDRHPHLMVEMISNAHGEDDKITREELRCIFRTMGKLLKSARLSRHIITPVCCHFQLSGKKENN